ncbi:MAG: carboxylating nicotinate-nucleotide diphosphorylase [Candidatus Omnitrophota bacterium]
MVYNNNFKYISLVQLALKEDLGKKDITTQLLIPKDKTVRVILLAKQDLVACGLQFAREAFTLTDSNIKFIPLVKEGEQVKKGKILARIQGKACSILTAERVALNFLSLMSAITTKTRKFTQAVKPYKTRIVDTRKTIPGLRLLQKYAVRIGGGFNHRFSLDEMIMVKDNHLHILGSYRNMKKLDNRYKVELEVDNLKQFKEALELKPDIIMLDNMPVKDIKKAVVLRNSLKKSRQPAPQLESSGGITLKNIRKIASTGVDMISIGGLTHSIDSVDISLEII